VTIRSFTVWLGIPDNRPEKHMVFPDELPAFLAYIWANRFVENVQIQPHYESNREHTR
jgi:hypothetical protein